MSGREVRIDRLQLRLPVLPSAGSAGSREAFARSVASSLAAALKKGGAPVANRATGEVRVPLGRRNANPGEIAEAIFKAISRKHGGR
jgi:hypothetical protein